MTKQQIADTLKSLKEAVKKINERMDVLIMILEQEFLLREEDNENDD
jgi:hypothetical protein